MGIGLPLFVWDVHPTLFTIGPVEVRYYGLMWALGFIISAYIISNIMKREGYSEKMFDSFFWYGLLSTVIGSRLGHCLFYDPGYYLTHPIEILYIHQGGMASHGAAVGLLIGLWLFSKKNKLPYIWSLDRIGILVAVSGTLVRIGNFMNSEIFGRPTSLPWGVEFVMSSEWNALYKGLPCHPTQLYEALAYLIIFVVMVWLYYRKDLARRRPGAMFGIFLIALFGVRFLIEFIKNPQEDFEVGMILNMGQLLSIPFIIAGCVLLYRAYRVPEKKLAKK
ncbi:MAG TPA: prolipoprotein diacylglyceryl transferase [Candidatus Alistipes merdigallinarum]|nr:prolipoprotein diacylglyceryl transferase [Candidatus Alistipes merdigallinarum]